MVVASVVHADEKAAEFLCVHVTGAINLVEQWRRSMSESGLDIFGWQGDAPQDWPSGPVVPALEGFAGNQTATIDNGASPITTTVNVGTATPIGNQQNTSPPAASAPPLTPNGTESGTPQSFGPGPTIIPPTFFYPFAFLLAVLLHGSTGLGPYFTFNL